MEKTIQNVKKQLKNIILENINNIKEVENPVPYEIKVKIRQDYKLLLQGVAIGTDINYDEIESILDRNMIGSHDLKHLLNTTHTAMELFKHAKRI